VQPKPYHLNDGPSPAGIGKSSWSHHFTLTYGLAAACLSVALLLAYWPVFSLQFQSFWDDQWVVVNHYTEGGLNRDNISNILFEFYHGQYAPVNQLYYTSLYSLAGYDPFWFHAAGLAIHLANVLLLYFFLIRLLTRTHRFEPASIQRIAFFTAMLMAVHPFLVEAVAWLSASKVILHAFFYLVAMHAYLSYLHGKKAFNFILVICLFVLAFGGKEQAVTFPVCLLLLDYALKRNFRSTKLWLEKLPFFALSLFFGVIAMLAQAGSGEGVLSDEQSYPFHQNLVFASYSLTEYLVKYLLPVKLSYLYPFPNQMGEAIPARFWIYPFAVIFIIISLWNFWKKKWVFFGMAFFVTHIAMVLHIIPISRYAIVADRYAYLASVGVFFTLAYFLDQAIVNKIKFRKAVIILGAVYVSGLGLYTHERTKVWYNTDTLKRELRELLKQRNDYQEIK
jgi:hypothetical protein